MEFCDQFWLTDIKKKHFSLFSSGGYFRELVASSWRPFDGEDEVGIRSSLGDIITICSKTEIWGILNWKRQIENILLALSSNILNWKLQIGILQSFSQLKNRIPFFWKWEKKKFLKQSWGKKYSKAKKNWCEKKMKEAIFMRDTPINYILTTHKIRNKKKSKKSKKALVQKKL